MRYLIFLAAVFFALPAAAEWQTKQSDGRAVASYSSDRYRVEISCWRGRGFYMSIFDLDLRGNEMDGVKNVMVWVTLPDGRTDRWPVDVIQEGPSISGDLIISDFNLEFFRNGKSFTIDAPLTGATYLNGDMKGTGAARLAFRERCDL
ncbi:hypothetical protein KHP62_12570 [Rhodobacteraceae bacterium NNCM2]|nr:hypothetical protein [Coraliihabitans acroporae]